ncbi:dienelactone hydrolase family protein [Marinimicrococcus flavescens]|uniref:Dienelactone hydrolase family protein n=1 Tax=Marinimicrococcus flavescens TaxID=3031815 RepID=A0AAP3XRG3_9PROT|nr:dienelactone hydrolase family protein [Marinimicrococcus flavescens]
MNQRIIELFDRFTHGAMGRRAFLDRLAVLAGGTAAAQTLLSVLENDYAIAQTIPADDSRLRTERMTFEADGTRLEGYLAVPADDGPHPGVVVIHENRGLNPHIEDVTRRLAVAGFAALAPDFLSPEGGTPDDPDKARDMIGELDGEAVVAWARAAVAALRARQETTQAIGAMGFCWGGGVVGRLAAAEPGLQAAVVYYGRQPEAQAVASIEAPLLLHYAGLDERINAGIPAFEKALKDHGKTYELHVYEGVNHAFNNDTNAARYDKEAAETAWQRTTAFLHEHLES